MLSPSIQQGLFFLPVASEIASVPQLLWVGNEWIHIYGLMSGA